jgi:ribosomal protein S18 acetylase RimI-like enzyme
MVIIRRLKNEEKSEILELGREIFREEDEIPLLRKAIAQCSLDLSFIAVDGQTIIGFALVCKDKPTNYYYDFMRKIPECYELAFLGISRKAQGRGIGGRLLKETLLAIFQTSNYFTCWLLVDTINESAIRLYEKMGFRRWIKTTPDVTSCPGYIMGINYHRYKKHNISILN